MVHSWRVGFFKGVVHFGTYGVLPRSGTLNHRGFLLLSGSLFSNWFLLHNGSLGEVGFLFLNSSLPLCGFLAANSSLFGHRLLKGDGSHTKFGFL